MTQRVSVAGIDGTGKTTLIHLARRTPALHGTIRAFRAPQYHEDPDSPLCLLSQAIDELSVLGDQRRDPILKAIALFLSITFYGDVENHFSQAYQPDFLLMERQALADSLTYASFYKSLLTRNFAPGLEKELEQQLGAEKFAAISNWVGVLGRRVPAFFGGKGFLQLPLATHKLFELSPVDLVRELQVVYHTRIPDQIVLLEVSADALQKRLEQKKGKGAPEELHEKAEVLGKLQAGLIQSCELLRKLNPNLKLHRVDTSALTPEQSLQRVIELIRS